MVVVFSYYEVNPDTNTEDHPVLVGIIILLIIAGMFSRCCNYLEPMTQTSSFSCLRSHSPDDLLFRMEAIQ